MTFRMMFFLMLLTGLVIFSGFGCGGSDSGDSGSKDEDSSGDDDDDDDDDDVLQAPPSEMTQGGGYVSVNDGEWKGYAWATAEGEWEDLKSSFEPEDFSSIEAGKALCVKGDIVTTFDEEENHTYKGLAMIGVNINQEQNEDEDADNEMPMDVLKLSDKGDGLKIKAVWQDSNNPNMDLKVRVQLSGPDAEDDETDRWCYTMFASEPQDADGYRFVKWEDFNSYCFKPSYDQAEEDAYSGQDVEAIVLMMPEESGKPGTVRKYEMCLVDIAYGEAPEEVDTGEPEDEDTGEPGDTDDSDDEGGPSTDDDAGGDTDSEQSDTTEE
ncbi:MAG: hypothetical protein JXR76_32405 [Deltaproteobacteria bacterium]|nr:hypothetical protein [Deltaproteobacteria bacterium]